MLKQLKQIKSIHSPTFLTDHKTDERSNGILGSITNGVDSLKKGAKNVGENIAGAIKGITDTATLIAAIVCDPSIITSSISRLTKITGYDLTPKEWETVFQNLGRNLTLSNVKMECNRVLRERENREQLELELREKTKIDTIVRETELAIYNTVTTLSNPIYTNFKDSSIREAHSLLDYQFSNRFLELCKYAANVFAENTSCSGRLPGSGYPTRSEGPPSSPTGNDRPISDNIYLEIVRKYILFLTEDPHDLIHKLQSHLSLLTLATQAQNLFSEEFEMVRPVLHIDCLDMVLPIETCFLGLVWCAMCYELLKTAYGDISVDKQTMVISSCNLFVILLFTLLAREGLPPVIDGGVSGAVSHITRSVYNLFHDAVKPILDLGISFANVAFERMGINTVITKHQTWNEKLSENIHKEGGHALSMWKAVNMLHTFRIADAFLCSILSDKSFCVESLKDGLMKLSPIPLNGEENKLLMLFWENPYKDGISIQSKPIYGVFFNYNSEIEAIYEKHAKNMGDELIDVKITGCNIFKEIHELNNKIGKSDPKVFDSYLVFCIAGKLKDCYCRNCIISLSQGQLAEQIYSQITNPLLA